MRVRAEEHYLGGGTCHEVAVSIDKMIHGEDIAHRPQPAVTVINQKMGIHEWSYKSE